MRILRGTLFGLACFAYAYSQSAAPVMLGISQDQSGRSRWTATNTGASTITAFAFTYDLQLPVNLRIEKASGVRIYDAATEPRAAKPIPQGQTVILSSGPATGWVPSQVRAVVFADGTSWGDGAWVERLLNRRQYMRRSLQSVIGELKAAALRGTARGDLVTEFQASLNGEKSKATGGDERNCIESVRGLVVGNLMAVAKMGNQAPPISEVIAREVDSLETRLAAILSGGLSAPVPPRSGKL